MKAVKFKPQETPFSKACSRIKWIVEQFFEQSANYGLKISFPSIVWWIGFYSRTNSLMFWSLKRLTRRLDMYLESHYQNIINNHIEYQYITPPHSHTTTHAASLTPTDLQEIEEYHIWVFWWQGEDSMPELVSVCYNQLKVHNDSVILITKDNIRQYADIPEAIYNKVNSEEISLTHLSDILRFSLLAERGGMWVDSTCFIPYTIPQSVKHKVFHSPSTRGLAPLPAWSDSRWCTWNMGTVVKHNPLFCFVKDMLFAISTHETCFPHYLLIDYLMDYAYRKFPDIKQMIDNQPANNTKRNELHYMLNKPFDKDTYQNLVKSDWIFKLSYKTPWCKSLDGEETFYGHLINLHHTNT